MRVFKLGVLSAFAIVAFAAAFSAEVLGQDERMVGGGSGITVFEDRNFRGDAATYQNNVSNLNSRFNNRISSIRVGNGEQWQICDQSNYRGQCVTVSGEESNLGRNNWDNRISSMRRISGGWPGGPWNPGGGQQVSPPSWARGTFYGMAPNGTQIVLTVSSNGSVTANIGGSLNYGSFVRGNLLRMNEALSRVTRQGDGFSTTRTDNGERIVYSRDSYGGNPVNPGEQVSPPSWARGTFFGIAPDGTRIILTISREGGVTANIGGSINYGSFLRGDMLRMNEALSRVSRQGNGFATTRTDNGERIVYTRR